MEKHGKMTMHSDVTFDILQRALRFWWVLVLAGLVGALVGFGIHFLLPPVYQAQASITVNIDYALTGELTDVEEDHMIIAVSSLASSDEVTGLTLEAANNVGMALDRTTFDEYATLQRSFTSLLFIVRHSDPNSAAQLSNLWAETAWGVLTEAYGHIVKADEMQIYAESLACCTVDQVDEGFLSCVCNEDELSEMRTEIEIVSEEIESERLASKGLAMGTLMAFNQRAQVPVKSAILGRNLLVFVGALIGLVAALIALFILSTRSVARGET